MIETWSSNLSWVPPFFSGPAWRVGGRIWTRKKHTNEFVQEPYGRYSLTCSADGIYPHAESWEEDCISILKKHPRAQKRSFRKVETKDLAEVIQEALHRAALDGVSMAAASGSLVGGHDKLVSEILAGAVRQVVLADDASPRTVQSLRTAADRAREEAEEAGERVHDVIFVTLPIGREALGTRTGRGARAALGVRPTRGSAFLRRQLRRLRDLG